MVTPMPIIAPPPELASLRQTFRGYALGFVLHDYRGALVVSHTGVLPGYLSKVVMVPELKFGIAVLTNQESSDAYESIIYHLLDHTMHAPPNDWIGAYRSYRKRVTTRARQRTVDVSRDSLSHPSLSLRKYAGLYTDAWYGDVAIAEHNDSLTIRCEPTPSLQGELIHWQDDTFLARWYDRELRADALVTFSLTPEGSVDHVTMKAASPETDFSYDFQDLLLKPSGPGK